LTSLATQFRLAEPEGKLLRLPTGDGGALVFRNTQEAPVVCFDKIVSNEPWARRVTHAVKPNEATTLLKVFRNRLPFALGRTMAELCVTLGKERP
jgi:hypothetical protein